MQVGKYKYNQIQRKDSINGNTNKKFIKQKFARKDEIRELTRRRIWIQRVRTGKI